MNYPIFFKRLAFFFILAGLAANFTLAQTAPPREQKLLNGLKLLVWNEPAAEKTMVKLRIHSGAAFDQKDKMGAMALLGEILFANEQARAYFTEDLEGSLDVTTTYDYIQITATGKSSETTSILETLAAAVTNPQITPETFKVVRDARLKKLQELEKNPSYVADRAVAKRLFGEFPYGRSPEGTVESLNKLDYADIVFAKQRFLTSDNATLTLIGNLKPEVAHRVCRQLFGVWVKSDQRVPATFAMPNEPDIAPQKIEFKQEETSTNMNEIRFASRGVARKDKDYWAMRFVADVLQNRFRSKVSNDLQNSVTVVHERNLLPSLISFKFSFRPGTDISGINPLSWLKDPISSAEFDQTRTKVLAEVNEKSMVDKLLDIDTYKLTSAKDEINKLNSVSQADVQRVAEKLAKQPFVNVTLGN